ncbi:hypothetical protein ACIP93_24755 [Streptomyces sp. NPDC088745]|uniref:hypothetical protein n=1 Tax=Streptomyces sp. NPDC088745 TaxID=3365884 RepID=UPI0037F769FE
MNTDPRPRRSRLSGAAVAATTVAALYDRIVLLGPTGTSATTIGLASAQQHCTPRPPPRSFRAGRYAGRPDTVAPSGSPDQTIKGEYASWQLLLRPADDDQDDVPPSATAPAVTVSAAADATRIEVVQPVGTGADLSDDRAADVIVEGSPYAVQPPAGSVRTLTRLISCDGGICGGWRGLGVRSMSAEPLFPSLKELRYV